MPQKLKDRLKKLDLVLILAKRIQELGKDIISYYIIYQICLNNHLFYFKNHVFGVLCPEYISSSNKFATHLYLQYIYFSTHSQ